MDIAEIRAALTAALVMRPPMFMDGEGPREKVAALEDYLLSSAYVAAGLEEALHWLSALGAHFAAQVDQITGYEVALPRKTRDRITKDDILLAKRVVDPATFEAGIEAKALRASVLRQIERLRFEEQYVISRYYTMVTGG
jgi:hypothetical protein